MSTDLATASGSRATESQLRTVQPMTRIPREAEMVEIADLIATAVTQGDADPGHPVSRDVRGRVTDLVTHFPAYPR